MKEGSTYIVKKGRAYSAEIYKVKIIEVTKLTLAVIWENNKEYDRYLIADFEKKYSIIEELESDPIETETIE
jgi:hypothetical protein